MGENVQNLASILDPRHLWVAIVLKWNISEIQNKRVRRWLLCPVQFDQLISGQYWLHGPWKTCREICWVIGNSAWLCRYAGACGSVEAVYRLKCNSDQIQDGSRRPNWIWSKRSNLPANCAIALKFVRWCNMGSWPRAENNWRAGPNDLKWQCISIDTSSSRSIICVVCDEYWVCTCVTVGSAMGTSAGWGLGDTADRLHAWTRVLAVSTLWLSTRRRYDQPVDTDRVTSEHGGQAASGGRRGAGSALSGQARRHPTHSRVLWTS